MSRDVNERRYESDEHALFAGMLVGLAWHHGLPVKVDVDANGNYLPTWTIDLPQMPPNTTLTVIVPPPPLGLDLRAWLEQVRSQTSVELRP